MKLLATLLAVAFAFSAQATTLNPGVRPAKYANTYPKEFHDKSVNICVDNAKKHGATPQEMEVAPIFCDCIFWNIEDHFTFDQLKKMTPEQRGVVFDASVNGCLKALSDPEKAEANPKPKPKPKPLKKGTTTA